MKLIGLLEGACGLGMIMGPLVGTMLFQLAGYDGMLLIFGGIFLIFLCFMPAILPEFLDEKTGLLDQTTHSSEWRLASPEVSLNSNLIPNDSS
jgi:MFS family permease